MLTEREKSVLLAVQEYIKEHGYPPTVRELCKLTYLSSTSSIVYHLSNLDAKGYLKVQVGKARAIKVLREVVA